MCNYETRRVSISYTNHVMECVIVVVDEIEHVWF